MNRDADVTGANRQGGPVRDSDSPDAGDDARPAARDQLAEKIHSTDGVSTDEARLQITSFEDQFEAMDELPDLRQREGSTER